MLEGQPVHYLSLQAGECLVSLTAQKLTSYGSEARNELRKNLLNVVGSALCQLGGRDQKNKFWVWGKILLNPRRDAKET